MGMRGLCHPNMVTQTLPPGLQGSDMVGQGCTRAPGVTRCAAVRSNLDTRCVAARFIPDTICELRDGTETGLTDAWDPGCEIPGTSLLAVCCVCVCVCVSVCNWRVLVQAAGVDAGGCGSRIFL
jgi:hypothetical protein